MPDEGATKDKLRSLSELQHAAGKPVSIRTFDGVGAYDEDISDDGEGAFSPFTIGIRGEPTRNEARRAAKTCSNAHRLLLITGSPRSGTTALHNAFISAKLFAGIVADDQVPKTEVADPIYTDEFYPTMQPAIAATIGGKFPLYGYFARHRLRRAVDKVHGVFSSEQGLMLKAPHYVFGLPAFSELFSDNLRIIYVHRHPFSIAQSMVRHPVIGPQLHFPINRCTDFGELGVPEHFSARDVFSAAQNTWAGLPPVERALFVWHLYANAFVTNLDRLRTTPFILKHETFESSTLNALCQYLKMSPEKASGVAKYYTPRNIGGEEQINLTANGKRLWESVEHLYLELNRLSKPHEAIGSGV